MEEDKRGTMENGSFIIFRGCARDYWLITATGLLTGAHWAAYFHAIQISTVAVGIISLYTFPIMTAFLEPLFDREMVPLGNVIRAAIVFVGLLGGVLIFGISVYEAINVRVVNGTRK